MKTCDLKLLHVRKKYGVRKSTVSHTIVDTNKAEK